MDRCALFVDAGYALADGAMAVHGTRRRDSVSWDHAGLLKLLAGLARDRTGLPVLRCYWYETADGRTCEHDALAEMPGLKLRLSTSANGQGKGIESQVRRDLVTLAKSGAISDAFIASANDHLAELVSEVQDLGLRVVVLHIDSDSGWTIPQPLRQECDDIVEVSSVHLRPFVDLIRGAEPSLPHELPQRTAVTESDESPSGSPVNGVPGRTARPAEAVPVAAGAYQPAEADAGYGSPRPQTYDEPAGQGAAAAARAAVAYQASPAGREPGAANGAGSGAHHAAHAASVLPGNPYGPRAGELAQDRAASVAGAAGNGAARGASRPNGAHAANSGEFPVLPDAARPGTAPAGAGRPGNSGQFAVLADGASAGAGRPGNSGQFPVRSPDTADGDQGAHSGNGHAANGHAPYAPAQAASSYAGSANGSPANDISANGAAVNGAGNGGSASSGATNDRPRATGGATGIHGRQGDHGRSGRPPFATGPQPVVPAPDGATRSHPAPAGHRAPSVPASYQVPALPGAEHARPGSGSGLNRAGQNGAAAGPGSRDGSGFRDAQYQGSQANGASAGTHSANGGPGGPRPGFAPNGGTPNGGTPNGAIANTGFATGGFAIGGFVNGGNPNGTGQAGQSNSGAHNGARNGGVTSVSVPYGGFATDGAANSGVANGGFTNGGVTNGGVANGGVANGGVANGGVANGGVANGGVANGEAARGGANRGASGSAAGSGGVNSGIANSGAPTGGVASSGASASGWPAAAVTPAAGMPAARFEAAPVPGSASAAAPNPPPGPVPNRPARPATGDQAPLSRPPQSFYPAGRAYGGHAAASREQPIPALPVPGAGPAHGQHAPQQYQQSPYGHHRNYQPQPGPALPAVRPAQPVAVSLADAVEAAHNEGFSFGESVGRDAPGLWLEAVLARKPRMPSDLEARLLQGSVLPIDSLLHDEVRHSLRRGFWDALESTRR